MGKLKIFAILQKIDIFYIMEITLLKIERMHFWIQKNYTQFKQQKNYKFNHDMLFLNSLKKLYLIFINNDIKKNYWIINFNIMSSFVAFE